jgi:hypothetical protein
LRIVPGIESDFRPCGDDRRTTKGLWEQELSGAVLGEGDWGGNRVNK